MGLGLEKINTNQEIWRPKAIYHYISWMSQNLTPKKYKSLSSIRTTIPSVKSLEQLALISKTKILNYLKSF